MHRLTRLPNALIESADGVFGITLNEIARRLASGAAPGGKQSNDPQPAIVGKPDLAILGLRAVTFWGDGAGRRQAMIRVEFVTDELSVGGSFT